MRTNSYQTIPELVAGGIRVAGLVRWPGRIEAGSESRVLCHSNDLLPTICSGAGVPLPEDDTFDGTDILPLLTGKSDLLERETVFWQIHLYRKLQRHYPKPKPTRPRLRGGESGSCWPKTVSRSNSSTSSRTSTSNAIFFTRKQRWRRN